MGSSDQHGHGQPTDTADLDEGGAEGEDGETPAEIGYLLGLVDRLVDEDFDGTFATLYKAFTSFRLAKLLAARRIYLLGMLRTSGRPKNFPRGEVDSDGAANYWPYRGYSKKELEETARGFARRAYAKLKAGDIEWLVAELWRDSRWVTLLGTAYLEDEGASVRRWFSEARERRDVTCSPALKRYNAYMGAVDQFNKMLAATRMGMGRCKQRFHRALFLGWLLPAAGVVNVRIALSELVKSKFGRAGLDDISNARGVGDFNRWFQRTLGKLLIVGGTRRASEALNGDDPSWMPSDRRHHWELPWLLPPPPRHGISHLDPVDIRKFPRAIPVPGKTEMRHKKSVPSEFFRGDGRCHLCVLRAKRAAKEAGVAVDWAHSAEAGISWSSLMCRVCRVRLCELCWGDWHNHEAPAHLRECPPCHDQSRARAEEEGTQPDPQEQAPQGGQRRRHRKPSRPPQPFQRESTLARRRRETRQQRDAEEEGEEENGAPVFDATSPMRRARKQSGSQ